MAEPILASELYAEGAVGAEAIGHIGSHLRDEGANGFGGLCLCLGNTGVNPLLNCGAVKDVPCGLAGVIGTVSGVDGGAGSVATIGNESVDHVVLSPGESGITGFGVNLAFGHCDNNLLAIYNLPLIR